MRLTALKALFKFAPAQLTVLTLFVYAAVFVGVIIYDEPSKVPKDTHGLDNDRAYDALSQITAAPHPYISHTNDVVRQYILSRLRPIAARQDYIHLSDDMTSNVTYVRNPGGYAVYFEGNNVLLKIDGNELSSKGVLFSCHFDSVSTAPGATDDGMAVATLLEMAEYLSWPSRRPRRTAVFFFNNGEEDGLNGAHAYFEHPWSNISLTFINLEGAASGGRPLVFRSTAYGPAQFLRSKYVKHPHASIVTSEAFSTGMIRSTTDYEIYAHGVKDGAVGLQGFDLAFYKNRAYYHTSRDSISGMGHDKAKKALWAMLETVRGSGLGLLNDDEPGTDASPSVYFDILGQVIVVFKQSSFYAFNIALLVLGPLVTLGLITCVVLASKKRSQAQPIPASHIEPKWRTLIKALLGWERFWVALLVAVLVHVGFVAAFLKVNPNIVHSHAYAVLATFLGASFLALVLPLQALHSVLPPIFVSQKLATMLSLYSFSWILLVASTILLSTSRYAFLYWATILNVSALLAVVLELVRAWRRGDPGNERGTCSFFNSYGEQEAFAEGAVTGQRQVRGVLYEAPERLYQDNEAIANGEDRANDTAGEVVETDPTEITPLIHQHRRQTEAGSEYITVDVPDDVTITGKPVEEFGWWIGQALLLVPPVAVLLFQVELLLLNAIMHTLPDGSPPSSVYLVLAVFSTLIFIPITPFAHKLPQKLNVIVAGMVILILAISWATFPFTQQWPFRVYFQQSVEISSANTGLTINTAGINYTAFPEVVRAETTVTGLPGYIDRYIVPDIPSARHTRVNCDPKSLRPDLITCSWETNLLPFPGGILSQIALAPSRWLDVHTTRLNETRALISVRGANTRGCRLYFDRPATFLYVHQATDAPDSRPSAQDPVPYEKMRMQGGYEMPDGGVREMRMWSRTWDRTFVVEVGWEQAARGSDEESQGLTGRAACEYAEYASALGGPGSGLIPAYEEVKEFLPLWALPSKLADGLAEVWTKFSV
ncbi:hypothetical protein BC628DRAFT_1317988 [Trametes gibbosa]|nr:hypothetical protein BC628DRAFT_1317988 [Trametes gibbosa]